MVGWGVIDNTQALRSKKGSRLRCTGSTCQADWQSGMPLIRSAASATTGEKAKTRGEKRAWHGILHLHLRRPGASSSSSSSS